MSHTSHVKLARPFENSVSHKKELGDTSSAKPKSPTVHKTLSLATQPIHPPQEFQVVSLSVDARSDSSQVDIVVAGTEKKASLKTMKRQLTDIEKSLTTNPSQLMQNLDALSNFDFLELRRILHGRWKEQITVLKHLAAITKELIFWLETKENPTNLSKEELKEQIIGILSSIWSFVITKTSRKRAENDQLISNLGSGIIHIVMIPFAKFIEPFNILLGTNIRNPITGNIHKQRPLQYFESREIITELATSIREAITARLHR